MRYLPGTLLLLGPGIASAHTLGNEHQLLTRFAHQLAGLHHLPLALLVIAAGALLVAGIKRSS